MAISRLQMRTRSAEPLGLLLLAGVALAFGFASALFPAWFVLSVLLVPAVATLLLLRPELALVMLIALTCGLIHPALVPRVPLLGGSVAASDATLVMLAAYALFSLATQDRRASQMPAVPGAGLLAVALGLFGVAFVNALVVSLWFREVNPTWVLGEARRLLYLTALPIAVVVLRQRERQERFVIGLVVLGCLFAVGQILQGVFNVDVFGEKGRMVVLETLGRQDYGTTRTLTLGIEVIVFSLLLTVGAYVLGAIPRPVFLPVAGLLLAGIFLSFGRTTFVVVAICICLVVSWLKPGKLLELTLLLIVAIAIGSALASIWKPDSLAAVYYRMTTIDTEVSSGDSAQWRIWEAEEMLPHIQKYPFAGLGLGADYKATNRSSDPDLNRYVHNAYLYMAGKMGIPALLLFLTAVGTIFALGRRSAKSDGSAWTRVVGASCAALMLSFLLASVTEPHFMVDYSLVLVAIAGALAYLSAQRNAADALLDRARRGGAASNALERRNRRAKGGGC